jgi:hypothetical protein
MMAAARKTKANPANRFIEMISTSELRSTRFGVSLRFVTGMLQGVHSSLNLAGALFRACYKRLRSYAEQYAKERDPSRNKKEDGSVRAALLWRITPER